MVEWVAVNVKANNWYNNVMYCNCSRCRRSNPEITSRDGLFVFADDIPFTKASRKELEDENILVVGPFPLILHYPNTYILYFFKSPEGKALFERILSGEEMPECKRCLWRKTEETPCCEAAAAEFEWWTEDGDYIGPPEYEDDPPECECACECIRIPVFHLRRALGGPGTIEMFWQNASTQYLVGAVQYVIGKEPAPDDPDYEKLKDQDFNYLLVTHMAVSTEFQRNKVNTFMIDLLVSHYPHRILYFDDPTDQGRAFMDAYGGSEWGA